MTVDETPSETPNRGDRIFARMAESLGGHAGASLVFGEPVDRDGTTVIPVAKTRYGFGFGGGAHGAKERGGGGGGGAAARPVGYIEIRNGETKFHRIGASPALLALAAIAGSLAIIGWGCGQRGGRG